MYRFAFWTVGGALLFAGYLGGMKVVGNFHESAKGELYRSGQLTSEQLGYYVHQYHIRTVINLRGSSPGRAWYDDEIAEARQLGVNHIDYHMSAKHELTSEQTTELVQLMRDAPKPVLVHCKDGADRTGLAAALYLAAIDKDDEFDSELQLSLLYGHVPMIGAAEAMNNTFERYEPKLGFFDS